MASNPSELFNTISNDCTKSVGSSATLLDAKRARRMLRVQNTHGSQLLYLGTTSSVSDSAFMWRVAAAGGQVELDGYSGDLYGYGSGPATTCTVLVGTA